MGAEFSGFDDSYSEPDEYYSDDDPGESYDDSREWDSDEFTVPQNASLTLVKVIKKANTNGNDAKPLPPSLSCGHCCRIKNIDIKCTIDQSIKNVLNEANSETPVKVAIFDEHKEQALTNNFHIIAYDLETTGLALKAEIINIAAISSFGSFERFIIPKGKITPSATAVNGCTKETDQNRLIVLKRNGITVETVPLKDAMLSFLEFLEQERARYDDRVTLALIAHNGNRFDAPKIAYWLKRVGLNTHSILDKIVFGDSLTLARKLQLASSCALKNVFDKTCPGEEFDAHTALVIAEPF